jgi:hypothetical protein
MSNPVYAMIERRHPLVQLLGDAEQSFCGFVYSMHYDAARVLTNDRWKQQVGGVPQNSFLVGASFDAGAFSEAHPIDQQVVLLRVQGPADLPQDRETVAAIIDNFQRKTALERNRTDELDDELDVLTRHQLQFGGLACAVLGTFYMRDDTLRLGADVESYVASSHLRVYKPTGAPLRTIVNYVDPARAARAGQEARRRGFREPPQPFRLGTVRYTSTDRLHRAAEEELVPVGVNPADFLSRRTAILGMTRTGKSNTVKTTAAAVRMAGDAAGVRVGQVIFDINGEYANANGQDDGSSIAEVFSDSTVRYRGLETTGFEDLRNNFYESPAIGLGIIQSLLRDQWKGTGGDMAVFLNGSLDEPDRRMHGERKRWRRHVAAFSALLYRAQYRSRQPVPVAFDASEEVLKLIAERAEPKIANPANGLSLEDAVKWWMAARKANLYKNSPLPSSTPGNDWFDPFLKALANLLVEQNDNGTYIRGYSLIASYRPYHSPTRAGDVEAEIYRHLEAGRIVILDLSVGQVHVRSALSERIARHVFETSMTRFHGGGEPPNIVMYVEEAHNLIGKGADLDETWPRIAKEGAKAQIALVYATQEPSSVHPNILANTENWFVTHLNNDDELRTLSKFYDFADFAPSLKKAQDVGFARVKTLSSPFVVPVQIDLFDPQALRRRRAAAATA